MSRLMIWYGQLTTRRRLLGQGALLSGGAALWLLAFLVLPLLVMAAIAFMRHGRYGEIEWQFTLGNFRRLLGYGSFGWSADYLLILARSVWVAFVTTLLCVLLAYPLAFFIASRSRGTRYVLLGIVMVPFCTNLVIRAFGWAVLLRHDMPLARLAQWLGLLPDGMGIYPGPLAVYLGMVSSELPFAVLPLYVSVERLDWSLIEAAQDLYASRTRVFAHAILPQTLPGLLAATILTFIPAMGAFVVPDLLGGAKYMLVGNLIQQQFGPGRDLPFGAAVSLALLVLTLAGLFLLRGHGKEGSAVDAA
jgi:spermidine/putrescine transport system permease protein